MEQRPPFYRAWGFLGFRPWPKRLAWIAAGGVPLTEGPLVVGLGLCVELLTAPTTTQLDWLGLSSSPAAAWAGLFGLMLGLVLIREALLLVLNLAAGAAAAEAGTRLRRVVYHHTFRVGPPFGDGGAAGIEAIDHIAPLTEGLRWTLAHVIPFAPRVGALMGLALFLDFRLALTATAAALALFALGRPIATWYDARTAAARDKAARFLTLFGEAFSRPLLVQAYRMETQQQGRAEDELAAHTAAAMTASRRRSVGRFVLALVVGPAVLGPIYFAGLLILSGGLAPGMAAAEGAAVLGVCAAFAELRGGRDRYLRARAAAAVVFRFLDQPGDPPPSSGTEPLPRLTRRIEFDGVALTGPDGGRLFHEFTLALPAGRRYALVGADDHTKQAFIALLLRSVDPTAGEVRFDQHNLRGVTLDSLRAQIGLTPRHGLLFTATVADNLRCGDEQYDLPAIVAAAKLTHAHHFVQKLPQGYETTVGPLGHPLSVGETFRLALARAVLRDPALLIVEEPPAGALDPDEEALLVDALARTVRGRTAVMLPHREPTLRACDEVLLLHRGQLDARGAHAELLAGSELYQHLFYREFNPFTGRL